MQLPSVSILLPFRQEGRWLKEAIDSIRQQSFTDWELLLLAHEADANSYLLAASARKQDARIKVHRLHGDHLADVLNQGLQMSTGRYIARMDADDVSLPQRLALQNDFLEKNPKTGVISCATAPHPSAKTGEGFLHYMSWQNAIISDEAHRHNRFIESPLAHPTVMFRACLTQQSLGYPSEGPEDYGLWLHWMQDEIRFYKLPEKLLLWRDHEKRLSRSGKMYTAEFFTKTRIRFARRVTALNANGRQIILCGAGTEAWKKKEDWEAEGIQFHGYSDVKTRNKNLPFHPPEMIGRSDNYYYISLLSGRGKATEMLDFFISRGLTPEKDFLVAS